MPQHGPKPKRQRPDSTRLKRDIARADSTLRGTMRMIAESSLAMEHPAIQAVETMRHETMARKRAQQDTLDMARKGAAPKGGHKSFAENTEGFDGASLSDRPPRVDIPRGNPARDAIPSATGTPALALRADGTENLGTTTVTKQVGETRAESSSGRGPSTPQHFAGDRP